MAILGFCLPHEQFRASDLIDYGVLAEAAGFEALWTSDHFHPWQHNQGHAGHAWITLAALGQRTTRVLLGTGVTCPTYRYRPADVAQAFASLAVLAPGRVYLGLGTGEALNELASGGGWGPYRERADRLVEAVEIIRRLWAGEWLTYRGRYFQTESAHLYDLPDTPVPIYIAAGGPKSMRLAGRYGDGLITVPSISRDRALIGAYEAGAHEVGHDPATMPRLVEHYVVVGDEAEARAAADLWRFTVGSWQFLHIADPRAIQQQAEATTELHEVHRRWTVSEDPAVHLRAIHHLEASGATHIFIHAPQQNQPRVIDFYRRQVLPKVNA